MTTQPHAHRHPHALGADEDLTSTRMQRLSMFLQSHFGEVELHTNHELDSHLEHGEHGEDLSSGPCLVINVDGSEASIDLLTLVSGQFHLVKLTLTGRADCFELSRVTEEASGSRS